MNIKKYQLVSIKKKLPIIAGVILGIVVAVFLIGAIVSSFSGGTAIKVVSAQSVFQSSEIPQFIFVYKNQTNIFVRFFNGIINFFSSENKEISASVKIFNSKGDEVDDLNPQIKEESSGKFSVDLDRSRFQQELRPGKYRMQLEIKDGEKTYTQEQDFRWGVLAINTNKSIYLSAEARAKADLPPEEAYLQFASLKDDGHTICDSRLKLKIKNEKGKTTELSTENGGIEYSGKCKGDNVTDVPDYFAHYQVGETGKYQMTLTNLGSNYSITDYFEVRDSVEFDIERIGPTRIFPQADYEVKIRIKANQDFDGEIIETVPMTFAIEENSGAKQEPLMDNYTKTITWQAKIKKGETKELSYSIDFPNISPYFYLIGPLKLISNIQYPESNIVFAEVRQWQIAADAETEVYITYDTAPTGSCGSNCWTTPADWNSASNSIEVIGGGGGAGDGDASLAPGGGGAGAYSKVTNLTLSGNITFGVGASGSGGTTSTNGTDGGITWFNAATAALCTSSTTCVKAEGGKLSLGGANVAGGLGGDDANGVGTTKYDGGTGGLGCSGDGGGGGGGAGGPNGDGLGNVGGPGAGDGSPGLGGGGGGGGGGSNGLQGTCTCAACAVPQTSGAGGSNYAGLGSGAGSSSGVGSPGTVGGGGGGGFDPFAGGAGGDGTDWQASPAYGSGGGGGGGGDGSGGGNGGKYGGGGGGGEVNVGGTSGDGAGGLIHIAYTPSPFTISGTCYLADQQNTCADCPGCIKAAVNGTLDDASGNISGGSWTITLTITTPAAGNPITIFKSGVADDIEAAAVTKWVSGTSLTGVVLYNLHLNIGHTGGAQTITNANISTYDNSVAAGNEDVFFESDGTNLVACQVAGCEGVEIYIIAGNTFQPRSAGSSYVETHDIEIDGTFDLTGAGNYASISGSWDNDSVFTAGASTIFFTATASAEIVSQSSDGTYAFNNIQFGDSATTGYSGSWTLNGNATVLDVNGNLTIDAGTLINSGAKNITLAGNLVLSANGNYTKGSGTFIFAEPTQTWTDNTSAKQDMGAVVIGDLGFTSINETNCNALSGWHWYTANGRSACWSKTLADSVSWNKGVGDDTDNPGAYTCASGYNLQQRMVAAAAGEWYKIVSNVDSRDITSSDNDSNGWPYISALAISDCVDGTRDLCSGNNCTGSEGTDWATCNSYYRTWAGVSGKSALPYLATDAGTLQADNDYWDACTQHSGQDTPLNCSNNFYLNRKVCDDGDTNSSWSAACGDSAGATWDTNARGLGADSCGGQGCNITSGTDGGLSFRVVVRP